MFSFFVNTKHQNTFLIEGTDLHHIKTVVKLQVGEQIYCVFESNKYLCTIIEISSTYCRVQIEEKLTNNTKKIQINLFAGIIREQRWDFVLQKATELGVDSIFPVEFQRNVVRIEEKKHLTKIERWQQICNEAAKQSKRTTRPQVEAIIKNLQEIVVNKDAVNLVAWEEETVLIKKYLQSDFKEINLVVGPEGGISPSEIKVLQQLGFKSVSLGQNILRAETASLYLLSAINYEKNNK